MITIQDVFLALAIFTGVVAIYELELGWRNKRFWYALATSFFVGVIFILS